MNPGREEDAPTNQDASHTTQFNSRRVSRSSRPSCATPQAQKPPTADSRPVPPRPPARLGPAQPSVPPPVLPGTAPQGSRAILDELSPPTVVLILNLTHDLHRVPPRQQLLRTPTVQKPPPSLHQLILGHTTHIHSLHHTPTVNQQSTPVNRKFPRPQDLGIFGPQVAVPQANTVETG